MQKFKNHLSLLLIAILACSSAFSADFGDESDDLWSSQSVYSLGFMEQRPKDSPGATTIITAEQIRNLGIRTLAEVMRLAPSMTIDYTSSFATVSRGLFYSSSNRMQVWVDGRSEINPLVAVVHWEQLPVPLESIAYIEVVPSQASSTHGGNAFYGAINIVTKAATGLSEGTEIVGSGSEKSYSFYGTHTQQLTEDTDLTASYKLNKRTMFDKDQDGERLDDRFKNQKFNLASRTKIDADSTLTAQLAVVEGIHEHPNSISPIGVVPPTVYIDSWAADLEYEKHVGDHQIDIKLYSNDKDWDQHWDVCAPQFYFQPDLGKLYQNNNALVLAALSGQALPPAEVGELVQLQSIMTGIFTDPSSFDTVCGEAQADFRYHTDSAMINDVWEVTEDLRLSTALQIEKMWIDSAMHGNGKTTLKKSKLFSSAEYLASDWLTFTAGFMLESLGHSLAHPEFSPRAGFNFHLNDYHTVKLLASLGKRLIDGIEVMDYSQVPVYFEEQVYGETVQSPFIGYFPIYDNKDHVERIESYEAVYLGRLTEEVQVEARYFEERMTNILNYITLSESKADYFGAGVDRRGGELSVRYQVLGLDARIASHYIDSDSHNEVVARDDYSMYGASAYVIKNWDSYTASLAYYGSSHDRRSTYDRIDARVAKSFDFGEGSNVEVGLQLTHHRPELYYGVAWGEKHIGKRDEVNEVTADVKVHF